MIGMMRATSCQLVALPFEDDGTAAGARLLRGSQPFPVEPQQCANTLGVTVWARRLPPNLWGVTVSPTCVAINDGLTHRRQRFALAHELAHVALGSGMLALVPSNEERFADRFARELLAPLSALRAYQTRVDQACDYFDVEDRVIRSQLAAANLLPTITLAEDGTVVCRRCGDIPRSHCGECSRYRRASQRQQLVVT